MSKINGKKIDNIKECYNEFSLTHAEISLKILTLFETEDQELKVDDIHYFIHFNNLSIQEVLYSFIDPLVINGYLKYVNMRNFNHGDIPYSDVVLKLQESKLDEINNYRYYKFRPIEQMTSEYESLLCQIHNYILSLLEESPSGLTLRAIASSLSEKITSVYYFNRDILDILANEGKLKHINYSDYSNGYIAGWDLKIIKRDDR